MQNNSPSESLKTTMRSLAVQFGVYRPLLEWREQFRNSDQNAFYRDNYESCAEEWQKLAADAPAGNPERPVWLSSGLGFTGTIKLEMLFGLVFRSLDYAPVFVLDDPAHSAWKRRFHGLVGHERMLDVFDTYFGEIDPAPEFAKFLEDGVTMEELLYLTYHQVDIGRIALSNIKDKRKFEEFDLSSAELRQEVYDNLVEVQRRIHQFEQIVDQQKPQMLFIVEKILSPNAELVGVCLAKGVPVIQLVGHKALNEYVTKRYTYDNRYAAPLSLAPETWDYVRQDMHWDEDLSQQTHDAVLSGYQTGQWATRHGTVHNKSIKTRQEMIELLDLDPQKKTAVIFSHVLWDATFFYGNTLFHDYENWLMNTIKAACDNPNLNWIVKLHPDLTWKLKMFDYDGELRDVIAMRSKVGKLPDHVTLVMPESETSPYSFFELADYGVTVRGSVGIEMAVMGTTVITSGTGRYSGLGFTFDSATEDEYLQKLANLHTHPTMTAEQIELARRYAHAIFQHRPLNLQVFDEIFKRDGVFVGDQVLLVDSYDELMASPDIASIKAWIASEKADYWTNTAQSTV